MVNAGAGTGTGEGVGGAVGDDDDVAAEGVIASEGEGGGAEGVSAGKGEDAGTDARAGAVGDGDAFTVDGGGAPLQDADPAITTNPAATVPHTRTGFRDC